MEIKKFKGESAFLVSVNPTQVVDYVCMTCYKRLNKIIRTITKESRPYQEDIWYEYGERDYKYSNLYLNDTNGFIYGYDKDEKGGDLVHNTMHSYVAHQCPHCGGWAYAIDVKIIPHIIELNKKGWKTEFSCSGHKKNGLFDCKYEFEDGGVVHRNKIYWTSPYIKFHYTVSDYFKYYIEMNEKKIRENYIPFFNYSGDSIYVDKSNVINSDKDYNELIESFLEFCESLPYMEEVKKEYEEVIGANNNKESGLPFVLKLPEGINPLFNFNIPFWVQDYIEKDKQWTEQMKRQFFGDDIILKPISHEIDLNVYDFENCTTEINPSSIAKRIGSPEELMNELLNHQMNLGEKIVNYNPFDPSSYKGINSTDELESFLNENGVEIIDKDLLNDEEKLKKELEEARDLFEKMSGDSKILKGVLEALNNLGPNSNIEDVERELERSINSATKDFLDNLDNNDEKSNNEKDRKFMRKDDFNSIDVPSPEEIAKAMANEFETEGSVSGEVVNRWKESIDKGKLGLKRKSQEWIDEMIKMQELEDEKIRRINEAQINIWDGYLDENGKLCISKSQFIRDFKEVHKDDPIFDLPIYSKEYLDVAWRCFLNDISDITKDKKAVLEEYFTPEKEKEQKEDENFIDDLFDSIDEDYGDEDEL